ncbi:MAG: hypothetical protein ABIG32_03810 [Candidatus Uhrbacteria bacterium]|nr:hypothetical protein [Patescibacteria group bacterium]MBU1906654.1 hypothetical protein [Patescibacteria group bacterium]
MAKKREKKKKKKRAKLGKHTSMNKDVKHVYRKLERVDSITKIVLGRYRPCRHTIPVGWIDITSTAAGGMKLKVFCGDGIQEMFVCCDPQDTKKITDSIAAIR